MTYHPLIRDGMLQVFDVEHGACSLLTVPNGYGGWKRMLIDCGHNTSTKWYPGEYLRGLGVSYLDQLVVTNYDEDHVSGYPNLLQQGISPAWIFRNPSVTPQDIRHLKSEDGMGWGIDKLVGSLENLQPSSANNPAPVFPGVTAEYFWNQYGAFDDENNLSLVLFLKVHNCTFLYTGDMECAGFQHLLRNNGRFREVVKNVNILMASHHGRHNGICPEMFDDYGCRPQLVVISDSSKQYTTQETTNYYASKASGIANFRAPGVLRKVLTTRTDGDLVFSFSNGGCTVY
jgi:beta-lactamase superfamily II metal-dependent hydrolase